MKWYEILSSSLGAGLIIWFLSSIKEITKERSHKIRFLRLLHKEIIENRHVIRRMNNYNMQRIKEQNIEIKHNVLDFFLSGNNPYLTVSATLSSLLLSFKYDLNILQTGFTFLKKNQKDNDDNSEIKNELFELVDQVSKDVLLFAETENSYLLLHFLNFITEADNRYLKKFLCEFNCSDYKRFKKKLLNLAKNLEIDCLYELHFREQLIRDELKIMYGLIKKVNKDNYKKFVNMIAKLSNTKRIGINLKRLLVYILIKNSIIENKIIDKDIQEDALYFLLKNIIMDINDVDLVYGILNRARWQDIFSKRLKPIMSNYGKKRVVDVWGDLVKQRLLEFDEEILVKNYSKAKEMINPYRLSVYKNILINKTDVINTAIKIELSFFFKNTRLLQCIKKYNSPQMERNFLLVNTNKFIQ